MMKKKSMTLLLAGTVLTAALTGCGVNYVELGTATADMAVDVLANGNDPATMPVQTLDNGIATVNTETTAALGLDYSIFPASAPVWWKFRQP